MGRAAQAGSKLQGGRSRRKIGRQDVAAAFASYPRVMRSKLMALRELIFATASMTDGVGELEETLRWGEPSYLTTQSKSGSVVRIGWHASQPEVYAIYFHCQTNLVARFRQMYPRTFTYVGNRSITFRATDEIPIAELRHCIALALTYHRDRQRRYAGHHE